MPLLKPSALRSGALLGLLLATTGALGQVVVAGVSSPVGHLTKEQVADIFLGKVRSLPGAGSAELLDLPESSTVREEFYAQVVGKSAAQARSYWAKLSFTGKGTPPKEVSSSAEVKKAVASNPSAIGYIEKAAVDSSVKVVYSTQ